MTDKQKLSALINELGLTYKDIANVTGYEYKYVKNALAPGSEDIPRWLKLAVYIVENRKEVKT